uniref:Uncharacterized protein n=1 Tax=Leersia perrieri TaxID=77586 RepID=A0A0D9VHC7_9ORYZ
MVSSSCSGGRFPGALSGGVVPKKYSKVPPLGVSRAATGAEQKLETWSNARSLQSMSKNELKTTIRKQLQGVELSPSLYDTAWVAMVPQKGSPKVPCFPQSVEWILKNQQDDGSWGISPSGATINKEIMLSTLACVLALKKWNVGSDNIKRGLSHLISVQIVLTGLSFIGRNFSIAMVEQAVPVGFNITFSGMLDLASRMGLEVPIMQTDIDGIFHLREIEIERDAGGNVLAKKAFMAYVSEGLGSLQDWNQIMTYQRKNGSLFNSPSTTAAAAIHNYNDRALNYLDSLTRKFSGPVPGMYPENVYSQLCMVDTLEKMGISLNFAYEIRDILDKTYSCWIQNEEEVMSDMATCAKAFRLLRMHGYDITSDGMAQFTEQSSFDDSIHGYLNDTKTLMELYKTSQVRFSKDDLVLQNIGSWSAELLKQQLSSPKTPRSLILEVESALKFPLYATLERLEHKKSIEQFQPEHFPLLKSGYCGSRANEEIRALSMDEFSSAQSVYQQDLQYLKSWAEDIGLYELKFARLMPLNAIFSSAATMFPPELSDARIAWSQNSLLTTAVDDLFDVGGSIEEMENFVALIDKWDKHGEVGFCSKHVEILFYAVYNTNKQIAAKIALIQNRDVVDHIAELWLGAMRGMMAESKWAENKHIPKSMEEYMAAAEESFALGPIVPVAAYFIGPHLSKEVVRSEEYGQLFKHMNIVGRLLNDVMTYEREIKMGKANSVLIKAFSRDGGSPESIEAAKDEIRRTIDSSRCELQRMVFREGGIVPRPCREIFWHMTKVVSVFYLEEDAYYSPKEMLNRANAVVMDPLQITIPPSC